MLLILFGRLPEVKFGPQTRACAVPFVYVVAVETSILEVLAPFVSTALLQLLHIGLLSMFICFISKIFPDSTPAVFFINQSRLRRRRTRHLYIHFTFAI